MSKLDDQIMAILFVASEPITSTRLAAALEVDQAAVEAALGRLTAAPSAGIVLSVHHGHYQLITSPEASTAVGRFLQQEAKTELSKAALETLAIIAYRGPITKSGIEEVRGVSSDTMLKNLMQRGLIIEDGRTSDSGRSIRYNVSHAFLQQFGLTSTQKLPDLEESQAT